MGPARYGATAQNSVFHPKGREFTDTSCDVDAQRTVMIVMTTTRMTRAEDKSGNERGNENLTVFGSKSQQHGRDTSRESASGGLC